MDDFFGGGTDLFEKEIMNPLRSIYEIRTEHVNSFKYLGLNIKQNRSAIMIDQVAYIRNISPIHIGKERLSQKQDSVSNEELKSLRILIGQLNWVATQTRPDLLFGCCELMSFTKNAKVEDLIKANKLLKQAHEKDVVLKFTKLTEIQDFKFIAFHDASYANLSNGGSQGGYIIFFNGLLW